ncbi:DUF1919 domain-containing protein [Neolewinella agarilytica]|uniref:DUF1919 domain-containing protein n=1 Tax=Neolewinella agarilytica TaxID=478744 RepID=UPI0023561A96|nr:DUF1919 domain-containing protein [Neolewinella agarilytica]
MAIIYPIRQWVRTVSVRFDRAYYSMDDFVLIANNCFGGEVYQRLGRPYNTPFIGLFVPGPDFVRLLADLDNYLAEPMTFPKGYVSRWRPSTAIYPLGILKDVEIHFVHYGSEEEALEKWCRRLERQKKMVDGSRFFFKICDRDGGTPAILREFHRLKLPNKISFGRQKIDSSDHVLIAEKDQGVVPDGVVLYRVSHHYLDVLSWVRDKRRSLTLNSKIKWLLKIY